MDKESKYSETFFPKFGYHLNRTGSILAAILEDRLAEFEITLPIWRVIWCVSTFGDMSLSELASHSGFEMSWLTRVVSTAQSKNYLIKTKDKKKKSAVRVFLTSEGNALIRDVLPVIKEIGVACLMGVPESDVETTTKALGTIYDNIIKIVDSSSSMKKKLVIARRTIGKVKRTNNKIQDI